MSEHTMKSFNEELDSLKALVMRLGRLTQEQLAGLDGDMQCGTRSRCACHGPCHEQGLGGDRRHTLGPEMAAPGHISPVLPDPLVGMACRVGAE